MAARVCSPWSGRASEELKSVENRDLEMPADGGAPGNEARIGRALPLHTTRGAFQCWAMDQEFWNFCQSRPTKDSATKKRQEGNRNTMPTAFPAQEKTIGRPSGTHT